MEQLESIETDLPPGHRPGTLQAVSASLCLADSIPQTASDTCIDQHIYPIMGMRVDIERPGRPRGTPYVFHTGYLRFEEVPQ